MILDVENLAYLEINKKTDLVYKYKYAKNCTIAW